MTEACTIHLWEMEFELSTERREDHESATGWYSEAVMATALQVKDNIYMLDLNNPLKPNDEDDLHRIYGPDVMGVVVNKFQTHWYAFKVVNERIWLLDSTEEPRIVTFQEFLECIEEHENAFLVRHL